MICGSSATGDEMVTSYEAVRAIFEKSPESRQDFEVGDLMPWFRKHISLFHGLKSGRSVVIDAAEFHERYIAREVGAGIIVTRKSLTDAV